MTSRTLHPNSPRASRGRAPRLRALRRGLRARPAAGFTLTEVLVVVGIIVILATLLLPVIISAYGESEEARVQRDLQTIAQALEAYKADHDAYPAVRQDPATLEYPNGAYVLCQALIAPGGEAADGYDGPGFRTRGTSGQSYGPYLNPEQFTLVSDDLLYPERLAIGDYYGNPVLYFPAAPRLPDLTQTDPPPHVGRSSVQGKELTSLYDADDNLDVALLGGQPARYQRGRFDSDAAAALSKVRMMLGDRNANGKKDADEALVTAPFVLWSAGPDNEYGPAKETAEPNNTLDYADAQACDDILYP